MLPFFFFFNLVHLNIVRHGLFLSQRKVPFSSVVTTVVTSVLPVLPLI